MKNKVELSRNIIKTYLRRMKTKRVDKIDKLINQQDVAYQDELVCILKPNAKKGLIVFTTVPRENHKAIMEIGLKTGQQLKDEGIEFGRTVYHPYSFFKAPYNDGFANYSSIQSEIKRSFGDGIDTYDKVMIRVDPDKTMVFSSEIRAKYTPLLLFGSPEYIKEVDKQVVQSGKLLSDYLKIVRFNKNQKPNNDRSIIPVYHLHTCEKAFIPQGYSVHYPYDLSEVNRNSEILVKIPHLLPELFIQITK